MSLHVYNGVEKASLTTHNYTSTIKKTQSRLSLSCSEHIHWFITIQVIHIIIGLLFPETSSPQKVVQLHVPCAVTIVFSPPECVVLGIVLNVHWVSMSDSNMLKDKKIYFWLLQPANVTNARDVVIIGHISAYISGGDKKNLCSIRRTRKGVDEGLAVVAHAVAEHWRIKTAVLGLITSTTIQFINFLLNCLLNFPFNRLITI